MEDVVALVCRYYRIAPAALLKPDRRQEIVLARQVCWHLIKRLKRTATVLQMGKLFGKDHTTVVHGLQAINNRMERYDDLRAEVEALAARIKMRA